MESREEKRNRAVLFNCTQFPINHDNPSGVLFVFVVPKLNHGRDLLRFGFRTTRFRGAGHSSDTQTCTSPHTNQPPIQSDNRAPCLLSRSPGETVQATLSLGMYGSMRDGGLDGAYRVSFLLARRFTICRCPSIPCVLSRL